MSKNTEARTREARALGTVRSLVQPRYRTFSGAESQMRASGQVFWPRMPCENRTISIRKAPRNMFTLKHAFLPQEGTQVGPRLRKLSLQKLRPTNQVAPRRWGGGIPQGLSLPRRTPSNSTVPPCALICSVVFHHLTVNYGGRETSSTNVRCSCSGDERQAETR